MVHISGGVTHAESRATLPPQSRMRAATRSPSDVSKEFHDALRPLIPRRAAAPRGPAYSPSRSYLTMVKKGDVADGSGPVLIILCHVPSEPIPGPGPANLHSLPRDQGLASRLSPCSVQEEQDHSALPSRPATQVLFSIQRTQDPVLHDRRSVLAVILCKELSARCRYLGNRRRAQ